MSAWRRRLGLSAAVDGAPLSDRARTRLLEMTFRRLVFSVGAIPFVGLPFVAWLLVLREDARGLVAWTLAYVIAALGMRVLRRRFEREARDDADFVDRWLPRVQRIAWIHGFCLAGATVVTVGEGTFEFALLLHISLAAIIAANATHQTPVLSVFQRFFVACWGLVLLSAPWRFPDHYAVLLPLSLLYALAIYRHARVAHQFFLQQVRLEEDGVRLAERYRLAKEEAEQALQAKNQFLTTASHDLRQPVHAMSLLVESIAQRNRDTSLDETLQDLRHGVRALNRMCNALLDLSRIESGAVDVHLQPVALAPLLDEVATLFRPEAADRGLSLRVRPPREAAVVLADPVLLRQSLVNLAHNALRYTSRGGVLLAARRRDAQWRLEIWDSGIGVADDERGKIFSPFYRPEHAWKRDSAGHGLGLAVVARCAGLMGATYGLASKPGRGSMFWLCLPLARDIAETTTSASLRPAPVASGGPLGGRCLIVEDDPAVASAWLRLLQAWGVEGRATATGAQALAALDEGFVPDAILCDQRLRSGESGFELLKGLLARCPDAAGAMVSGEYASPELLQAERDGYLVLRKPLDAPQLHALLAQWLPGASSAP